MTIIEELRENPEEGARRLERECKPGLLALARRLCNDEGDAEELVNRTLAEAVARIDSLLSQSALFGWMCQILVGCHAKDTRRKSNNDIVYPGTVPDMPDESAHQAIPLELDHATLRDAVDNLPAEDREVLLMHYFMDIPVAKMAKVLAIPAGTVKSRLHYARKALAAKLGAKVGEVAKKPGGKALLLALALAALTAVGAAVVVAVGDVGGRFVEASLPEAGPPIDLQQTTGDTMNIKSASTLLAAAAAFATGTPLAQAAEITFTGGDAANPTNLSSAANWSAAPGADTIGVIDLSQTPAQGYVVDSDLALAGLRIRSNAGKAVTIGGAGTLTLGADGYASGAKGNLLLRCPMATSADQFWNLATADITTYAGISGNHTLVISNYTYCVHSATVNYGGTLKYHAYGSAPNKWVAYRGTGKWATHVMMSLGQSELYHDRAADIRYGDIFPTGCTWEGDGYPKFLSVCRDSSGWMIFDEGDGISFSRSTIFAAVAGHFEQRGGTLAASDAYNLAVGYAGGNSVSTWPEYAGPSIYRMKGGTLRAANLLVGYANKDTTGALVRFEQTGGTVQTAHNGTYGGGVSIPGGGNSLPTTVAEYLLGGGTLSATGYGRSQNLGLCSPLVTSGTANGGGNPASLYTQTNGTATIRWFSLGVPKGGAAKDQSTSPPINDGYARFELSGGTFELWNKDWLHVNDGWNNNAAVSNSVYSFNFLGGDFRPATGTKWTAAARFPAIGGGSEWGGTSSDLSIVAPVSGSGTLVKKGTGGLFLNDATRFTGTLDVRGGVVSVDGVTEDIGASDADCFRWTADSLAATLSNGDKVTDWADVNGGIVATTNGNRHVEIKKLGAPTFKAAAYNGHAAVTFNNNSLAVPQASNPLYGKRSCTVVAVIKPTANTTTPLVKYGKTFLSVMPGGSLGWMSIGGVGDAGGTSGFRLGVGRRFKGDQDSGDTNFASRPGISMNDGAIHAVAVSIDSEKVSFTVDGDYTNVVWTGGTAVAPFGWGNVNWRYGQRGELFIGGHIVDNVDGASFTGDILEIRVYTNNLFSVAEQRQITKKLLQVYDGTPSRMAKFEKNPSAALMGTPGSFTSWAAPEPVATAASWDADTLDAADGAAVTDWASEDGTKTAAVPIGRNAPTLIRNAINGHAALRFSAAAATALSVSSADSPISGAQNFTAAIVWRSREKGTGTSIVHGGAAAGLVSTKQAADKSADMSLTYRSGSAVMAGYGHATADQNISTRKPCRLDDGEPHISILACDGDGKKYRLMTDGVFFEGTLANASARGAFDVMLGVRRAASVAAADFFSGDIAAVKLYDVALTKAQMRDLGEHWAKKYATQLLVGYAFDESKLRERGLGVTNVIVAEGARLSVPLSDDTPFTLKAGSTISGEGEFLGSYRLSGGATLDVSGAAPAFFDDLQLAGGSLRVDRSDEPGAKVRRLKASGVNVVDVTGADGAPMRKTVLSFDEAEIAEGTTWVVTGAKTRLSRIEVDMDAGGIVLKSEKGLRIIVR
ncbi:MAG: sigma-70 family RNA polymerase sigma factor [Kiritimatiellae bacterium]|nr:sigma-70 family RNA polymerase sigma factor [Kiritimatiellia bacterium]